MISSWYSRPMGLPVTCWRTSPQQHVVRVGVEPPATGIEQGRLLDAEPRQIFWLANARRVGGPFLHLLLVRRVAGDPTCHGGHLPERDLVSVGDALDVLVYRVVEREEPLVRGLEQKGGGEGLGDAAYPVVHLWRHRLPGSAVRHPHGSHPRVAGGLHGGHHPGRIALLERLLQCRVQIGSGRLFATPLACVPAAESPLLPLPPPHPLPSRSSNPVRRSTPFHIAWFLFWTNKHDPPFAGYLYPRTGRKQPPPYAPTFSETRHMRSSRRLPTIRIAPVRWRDAHRCWSGAMRTF